MTAWLEFHDSTLAAVNHTAKDVELVLNASVHRWDLVGDSWTGSGWRQAVRILVNDVGGRSIAPVLPIDISVGRVRVGTITHDNMVRLPFNASDAIGVWLQLTNADVIELVGRGVHIDVVGGARFVEDLPAEEVPTGEPVDNWSRRGTARQVGCARWANGRPSGHLRRCFPEEMPHANVRTV